MFQHVRMVDFSSKCIPSKRQYWNYNHPSSPNCIEHKNTVPRRPQKRLETIPKFGDAQVMIMDSLKFVELIRDVLSQKTQPVRPSP